MRNILPHISIDTSTDNNLTVYVEDYELFDYISDYLTETCGIEYDFMSEEKSSNKITYLMHFSNNQHIIEIENHLCKLKTKEIERIYSLNN